MNERIQELVKQASDYAVKMNPEQDAYGRAANMKKFMQTRDTKLVELVMLECRGLVKDVYLKTEPEHRACLLEVNTVMNDHFGVE